jgi:collagenase-like PrtC family protease
LYGLGIDGLIIQDVGLLELDLPPVPLIASTQMHNNSPEKVKFLEDVGFSRVILARELTLDQIADIRRQTTVELECFIHGALCVSHSGRCAMSYALGGRSGNRGQCAQPCRRSYTLKTLDGKDPRQRPLSAVAEGFEPVATGWRNCSMRGLPRLRSRAVLKRPPMSPTPSASIGKNWIHWLKKNI